MNVFNIGDKVRFLDEAIEGIVTSFHPGGIAGVTIEDDFELQVLTSQLVLLEAASQATPPIKSNTPAVSGTYSDKKTIPPPKRLPGMREQLYWLCFETDHAYELSIANWSEGPYLITVYRNKPVGFELVFSGELRTGETKTFDITKNKQLKNRSVYSGTALAVRNFPSSLPNPVTHTLDFSQWNLLTPDHLTVEGAYSWIKFGMETSNAPKEATTETVKEKFTVQKPAEIIDLHASAMNIENLNADSILKMQMDYFLNQLELAIAYEMKRIIFIHGLGNGVLKNLILMNLKNRKEKLQWMVADERQFGQGAIEIVIK